MNSCGRHLHYVIEELNIVIHNITSPTRIDLSLPNPGAKSILDLTLSSSDLSPRMSTEVTDYLLGSDHFVILSRLNAQITRTVRKARAWSYHRANWIDFRRICSENFSNMTESESSYIEHITCNILNAAEASIPLTRDFRKSSVPWWSKACAKAVRLKRAAFKKMKRSFHYEDVLLFKKRRAEARQIILREKREYWRSYCETLNSKSNFPKVWGVIEAMGGYPITNKRHKIVNEGHTII